LDLVHQRAGYYTDRNRAAYWKGRNAVGFDITRSLINQQSQSLHTITLDVNEGCS
jgi:hypothetical protein